MKKMEMTFKSLIDKINTINQIDVKIEDKLTYGVKKLAKKLVDTYSEVNKLISEEISDCEIEHASTNEDGTLKYEVINQEGKDKEPKRFLAYTPKGLVNKNKAVRGIIEKFDSKLVEVEPYIATITDRTFKIDELIIEELDGLLFDKKQIDKEREGKSVE